jgi:hypothetical protein
VVEGLEVGTSVAVGATTPVLAGASGTFGDVQAAVGGAGGVSRSSLTSAAAPARDVTGVMRGVVGPEGGADPVAGSGLPS